MKKLIISLISAFAFVLFVPPVMADIVPAVYESVQVDKHKVELAKYGGLRASQKALQINTNSKQTSPAPDVKQFVSYRRLSESNGVVVLDVNAKLPAGNPQADVVTGLAGI